MPKGSDTPQWRARLKHRQQLFRQPLRVAVQLSPSVWSVR
jgi:hypothetical protein